MSQVHDLHETHDAHDAHEDAAPAPRADVDILADVEALLLHYPPLNNDRYHLEAEVNGGVVTVRGHVKTVNTHSYLHRSLRNIPDVTGVDDSQLYVDDVVRLAVGQHIPVGLSASLEYGAVILTGQVPAGMDIDEIAQGVGTVPGVERVIATVRQ